MKNFSDFIYSVKSSKNIVIISHIGPDGDTLGSALALYSLICGFDGMKRIDCIINGKIPDIYKFLPGIQEMKTPYEKDVYDNYDLAIAVDCAAIDRIGDALSIFKKAKKTVNIDHHVTGKKFADINIIKPTSSSTGEVIFDLMKALELEFSDDVALCLYTAILTDTGGFRFDNTTGHTFSVAKQLVKLGINPSEVYRKCYENKPLVMFRLHNYALGNAVFTDKSRIAYTMISRKTLKDFGADDDHIDGISESLKQIDTVAVSMVLKETIKHDTKISFRSKEINVADIAKFFGGGGHDLAAGCTICKPLNQALDEILPIVEKQVKRYYENSHKK